MKKALYLILFGAGLWLAARTPDVLTETGVTMDNIREDVLSNLTEDQWFLFNSTGTMRKVAKRIPEGSRAGAVRALGRVVRAYVESQDFRNEYVGWLKQKYQIDETYSNERVAEQEKNVDQMDGMVQQQMGAAQQAFAQLDPAMLQMAIRMQLQQQEKELAGLSASERARQANEIARVKRMLAATEGKPAEFKKQYLAYQTQVMKQNAAQHVAEGNQDLADAKERNAEYRKQKAVVDAHSDFRPALRKRLQHFIALCDDVNFDAKVTTSGYRREFVSETYQRKPQEWKFLYRIGKEPVMEARAFAQEWLTDLQKTARK